MQGDLTDLIAMHRAIEGCARVYFGMSVSADYLTATVNTAAVARHHGVEAFVNMSQMTVTQMSITESTDSPQHKLHWLAEQALSWSGLPVVTMRPTVFLDGFFRLFAAPGVRDADELALPMGGGKTSPISAVDVARAVSVVLEEPTPHIGQIYNLTGFELADLEHYARVFSEALGRTIRYRDVPLSGWSEKLLGAGVPAHIVKHLSVMTELNKQGRYDRMTDDLFNLTGQKPISMYTSSSCMPLNSRELEPRLERSVRVGRPIVAGDHRLPSIRNEMAMRSAASTMAGNRSAQSCVKQRTRGPSRRTINRYPSCLISWGQNGP